MQLRYHLTLLVATLKGYLEILQFCYNRGEATVVCYSPLWWLWDIYSNSIHPVIE